MNLFDDDDQFSYHLVYAVALKFSRHLHIWLMWMRPFWQVDQSVRRIETHVPPMVKQAPAAARSVAADVKSAGVMGAASGLAKTVYAKYEPTAKGLYTKYEPMAEQYAASAWLSLNKFPIVPKVTQAVVPTAAYYSEKYNVMVQQTAEKGYKVASYLPLVPTEKIAKVFSTQPVASS